MSDKDLHSAIARLTDKEIQAALRAAMHEWSLKPAAERADDMIKRGVVDEHGRVLLGEEDE